MRQYGMFHAPFMSFFSQSFYRDVDMHWKGTGFAYLLLMLTICWIPTIIQFHHSVGDYVENDAPALIEQLPTITIVKGEASVDVAQPYEITDPDSDRRPLGSDLKIVILSSVHGAFGVRLENCDSQFRPRKTAL